MAIKESIMQINFTGHRMEITPALRTFTQEKFDKLERHFDKITAINVIFDVEKLRQIVEATILVVKGEVHASSESEDMYTAIDILVDKLDRQLIKHKEKIRDRS
jgi:putative sigma-54 modulation protein